MHCRFQRPSEERLKDQAALQAIFQSARQKYPQLQLAADQPYRASDVAVDCSEDVAPLPEPVIADVVEIFAGRGANVKLSSIHINAWMGEFNKLEMSLDLLQHNLGIDPDKSKQTVAYIGDSPNDEPMFEYFPLSVGVANIIPYFDRIEHKPRWITSRSRGDGFVEFAERLINRP